MEAPEYGSATAPLNLNLESWWTLWNMPNAHITPESAYAAMLRVLARYLDIVQSETREPDVWERLHLNQVLNDLNRSDPFHAYWNMRIAFAPPDNQSKDYPVSSACEASVASLNMTYFRDCTSRLEARGYLSEPYCL